ncbi:glycine betaine/proline transport system permease protein (plasmid) [Ketogulonicigenium robustum]|uniref:Glycine betaine/proline transport system permease protein n=1 Tax=Ketogulonicigenium robustum TaxID=92947 RepID=A0A1W6P3B5_9RHOB|nr:proline/glycine betaine ABC transporter permease [Ketogulonicigenium robustum]ARO15934.1 glycine betaine/proline transport system permease protein [Ketogulonicigenium robustum]
MASSCWGLPEFLCSAPEMSGSAMRAMRRTIDTGFKDWVRGVSPWIDAAMAPLQRFLNALESAFVSTPWIVVFAVLLVLTWFAGRSWKITLGAGIALIAIGWFGLWGDTMVTLSMVTVCTLVAIVIGLPIGILASRSERAQRVIMPLLDVMQTLPSFVYLIPVVVIFGIGKVPGMIAVVIYAMPPMIRLTNLGIRLVDREAVEAADAFGSSERQKLWNVQLPLSLPTLMTGVNQTIMMALSMVVVASMVGVGGLGRNVLQAINNQFFTVGFLNGFALVAIAITFDRATQAYGKRLQRHTEVSDE